MLIRAGDVGAPEHDEGMTVAVEMSEEQVTTLGAVTETLVEVDRTIGQLLAVKDGLLALGSRLAMEVGADAIAAMREEEATAVRAGADPGAASASAKEPVSDSRAAEAMELAGRAVASEFAAALRASDRTVQRRMSEAEAVVSGFPAVWRAQGAGRISAAHARVIVDAGAHLDDSAARDAYAEQLIGFAEHTSPNRVGRMARRIAERFQRRTMEARHRAARRQRRVWVDDRRDGMAVLGLRGPAALVHGAYDRLTALGIAVADGTAARADSDDTRRLDELRADLALDLLLTGTPAGHDPDAQLTDITGAVSITVPVTALLGSDDTPAELDGRVPIDPTTARVLAGHATGWDRVLTHPITGAILAVDRYRPSAELRRWLLARDQRCRFPGCGHPARDCDLDHTIDAAAGGPTEARNLGALCRRHHVTKHQTPWKVEQLHDGVFAWTSPTGRVYLDEPPPPNTTVQPGDDDPPPF